MHHSHPIVGLATILLSLGLPTTAALASDTRNERLKLPAYGRSQWDNFGNSVGISGGTAVVGAWKDDASGSDSGSVYLFDVATGRQRAELTPFGASAGDWFGTSVAIDGDTVIAGSPNARVKREPVGVAHLFDTTTGAQKGHLVAGDGFYGDGFGWSVAIRGTTVLVGAPFDDDSGNDSGSAYVFDLTTGHQVAKLLPNNGSQGKRFGSAVALSETHALVGSPALSGTAHLFDLITGQQVAEFLPADGSRSFGYGTSVALEGTTALVGSPLSDGGGRNSGAAYVFDTDTLQEVNKLFPADATNAGVGQSVAISGSYAIVGAPRDDINGIASGSAYVFHVSANQVVHKFLPTDGALGDSFGNAVAISETDVIVGAVLDDEPHGNEGSAYLFDIDPAVSLYSLDVNRTRYDRPVDVTLTGSGFTTGLSTTVLFDDVPSDRVVVNNDGSITCESPIRPPGQWGVRVTVLNSNGSDSLPNAFKFTPALVIAGKAYPGATVLFNLFLDPGDSFLIFYGLPPHHSIATPPFAGTLGVWPFHVLFQGQAWPTDTWSQYVGVPPDPNLSGLRILVQALAGPSFQVPKDAAWTNVEVLIVL